MSWKKLILTCPAWFMSEIHAGLKPSKLALFDFLIGTGVFPKKLPMNDASYD